MKVIFSSKETMDVVYKDRKARFSGELGDSCFWAAENFMKWMSPDRDKLATKEEGLSISRISWRMT